MLNLSASYTILLINSCLQKKKLFRLRQSFVTKPQQEPSDIVEQI